MSFPEPGLQADDRGPPPQTVGAWVRGGYLEIRNDELRYLTKEGRLRGKPQRSAIGSALWAWGEPKGLQGMGRVGILQFVGQILQFGWTLGIQGALPGFV
jgi:hypothetical protein